MEKLYKNMKWWYNKYIVYIYKDEELISLFKHIQIFLVCKQFRIIFLQYYKQKKYGGTITCQRKNGKQNEEA